MKQEKLLHSFFSFFLFGKLPKAYRILGIFLLMCCTASAQHKEKPADQGQSATIGNASNRSFSYNLKHKPTLQLLFNCTWST